MLEFIFSFPTAYLLMGLCAWYTAITEQLPHHDRTRVWAHRLTAVACVNLGMQYGMEAAAHAIVL